MLFEFKTAAEALSKRDDGEVSLLSVIRSLLVTVAILAAPAQAASSFLSLSTSTNAARFGKPVTLTATVTPAGATGSVAFYHGPDLVGIASVVADQARLTSISLSCGTQPLKAYYSGNANFGPSSSPEISMAVNSVTAQGFRLVVTQTNSFLRGAQGSGDFNGDGKADLVLGVNESINQISAITVFFGNGDGTFRVGPTTQIDSRLGILVVADLNGDGKEDVAVGGFETLVLLGNGDGTFQPPASYASAGEHIVTGDFNGDGILDIATGNNVLLGRGDGTFAISALADGISVMAAADLNHDGITDLSVPDQVRSCLSQQERVAERARRADDYAGAGRAGKVYTPCSRSRVIMSRSSRIPRSLSPMTSR